MATSIGFLHTKTLFHNLRQCPTLGQSAEIALEAQTRAAHSLVPPAIDWYSICKKQPTYHLSIEV